MRLQVCPGLHERVEPGESLLGQRPTKPDQRRPRDAQPGERALRLRLREAKLDVEADRKSTRLNSSHVRISYAVFCLKKKKKKKSVNIKHKKKNKNTTKS